MLHKHLASCTRLSTDFPGTFYFNKQAVAATGLIRLVPERKKALGILTGEQNTGI